METRTLPGGPAPEEMEQALQKRRTAHALAVSVHREKTEKVRKRLQELDTMTEVLGKRA